MKDLSVIKLFTLFSFLWLLCGCSNEPAPFRIGADISYVPQREASGASYLDENGSEADVVKLMAANHFNIIRLRIFVDPTAPGGYSAWRRPPQGNPGNRANAGTPEPPVGYCDLAGTVAMAKRIYDAGMEFALDFHYSDTWADPDKQYKPSSWEGSTGEELENKLYEYTKEVLSTLKEAGVPPVVVQIGNEINHGMVWPEGYINDNATEENWRALMGLYVAGQKATREVLPDAKLQVHLALGGENTLCHQFLDKMLQYGAEFDIIGLSYYEKWHETYNDLKSNLYDLAATYKKPLCVCEYNASVENVKIINDIVRSIPDGLGYGTMSWEPTGSLFNREGQMNKELFAEYEKVYNHYFVEERRPEVEPPFTRTFSFDEPIIGADISWVPQEEAKGKRYSDKGVERDVLAIMSDYKFNWVRLRLFVNPEAENGYSKEGFCGLEQTLAMAKRVKAANMKLLLDFHYSDTWADPGKQFKPSAWERMSGSGLEGQLYAYSNEVIKRFKDEGVTPDMVQIGNEINHGMIWPQGKIEDSYMSFGVLLRCASAGVRAADPNIPIMVHIACGGMNDQSVKFYDKIISRDVKFDVIGESYYPVWHGTLDDLRSNLNDLALRYGKPIVVVEYQEHRKEVNDIVNEIPNGLGLGTFIWEATSPRWGNLFDMDGKTNDNMTLYPDIYKSYIEK